MTSRFVVRSKKTYKRGTRRNDRSDTTHDMTKSRRLQADQPAEEWTTEVVARLPETLAQQAKARKRL
jgi:hypothetical protein